MASIADIFLRAALETKQLELDAQKAGDKAGQTIGTRMSRGIGIAMRAGLGLVSGAAAVATKGVIELDDTMAQFTADTGLAGKAADDAKASILAMSGRNLQPLREIGTVLGKVHTDMGLTGAAADATAESFLRFARVTGGDAASEVKAFDDILDAWGLTADKSAGLMDKLVVSHQKYGGSISENEAALSAMAPQLKALNLNIDDGIGLLNLFASSGLDASAGQKALNAAISKLPPGTSLQEFIAHLSTITDDGARAREAMTVFGTKAGAGLANAIRPGIDSLKDFAISTYEATGATDKARDAIDGTFSNQIKLKIKAVAAEIIKFGGSFGPALTGLASLASLGGSLGGGKLAGALAKGLASAWKSAMASSLVTSAVAKAGSFAATAYLRALIIGDALSGGLAKGWAKVPGSAKVSAAIAKAASLAATAYLKLLIVGDAIGSAISGAWTSVAGTGSKATSAAGLAGKAAGLAFKLGMLGLLVSVADDIKTQLSKVSGDLNIWKQFGIDAPDIHPEEWPWPWGPKGAPDWAGGSAPSPVATVPVKIAAELEAGAGAVADGAAAMVDGIPSEVQASQDAAVVIAAATPLEVAQSLVDASDPVKVSAALLARAIEEGLTPAKETAKLEGELTALNLSGSLTSNIPSVRAAANANKVAIEERLFALRNGVDGIAADTGQTYADALEGKKKEVRDAARTVVNAARGKMTALKADAAGYGQDTGEAYADALIRALAIKKGTLTTTLAGYANAMRAGSPPKPGAVLYGIDHWGAATGEAFTLPLVARLKAGIAQAKDALGGLMTPLTPAFATAASGALRPGVVPSLGVQGASPAGVVLNGGIHIDARGATDPAGVGRAVQQGVSDAMAGAFRDQSLRGVTGTRP